MRTRLLLAVCTGIVWIGSVNALTQGAPPRAPTPAEPIAQILASFRTHTIVTITDPHGNEQVQAFILALIRDQRFRDLVDDVVIETASSRYQDVIDRFVRGDDVPRQLIRKAWEDHTVANSLGRQAEELMQAVRAVNGSAKGTRKLRIIAGDPPIDWENITSQEDQFRWVGLRDSYPADLVRRQSVERGRRALVVYGQGHLQRHQVASNYDMSSWQAQTVVSLIEREARGGCAGVQHLDLGRSKRRPEGGCIVARAKPRHPERNDARGTRLRNVCERPDRRESVRRAGRTTRSPVSRPVATDADGEAVRCSSLPRTTVGYDVHRDGPRYVSRHRIRAGASSAAHARRPAPRTRRFQESMWTVTAPATIAASVHVT
jgi:hypothetical protein